MVMIDLSPLHGCRNLVDFFVYLIHLLTYG